MSIPRYLVSRSAITAYRDNAMITDEIGMVTYEDHLDAIEHLELLHRLEINEQRWQNETTREDSFRQGYLEGIEDCISIANQENFLEESGRRIPAMSALWNIIVKMQDLKRIR